MSLWSMSLYIWNHWHRSIKNTILYNWRERSFVEGIYCNQTASTSRSSQIRWVHVLFMNLIFHKSWGGLMDGLASVLIVFQMAGNMLQFLICTNCHIIRSAHHLSSFLSERIQNGRQNILLCCDNCPRTYCLRCLRLKSVNNLCLFQYALKSIAHHLSNSNRVPLTTCICNLQQVPTGSWICVPCTNTKQLMTTDNYLGSVSIMLQVPHAP
jgi:hypothetical protein